MKIGFLGAGRMGGPVVDRLRAAGHDVTVLVRSTERAAQAHANRWSTASTVTDTVQGAGLVICMVFDDAQVRDVLAGDAGALAAMRPGSVLIQHTTCDPATLTELGELATRHDVTLLDAAISGGPRDIEAGDLTLWVGGDQAAVAAVRPVLAAYSSPVLHVGPVGSGQRVKLVNNALFVAQIGLAVDAVRLAGSFGLEEAAVLAAVQHGSGDSRALGVVASIGAAQTGVRLAELMSKDVAVVREITARAGADLGLLGDVLSSDVVAEQVLCGGRTPDRSLISSPEQRPVTMKGRTPKGRHE